MIFLCLFNFLSPNKNYLLIFYVKNATAKNLITCSSTTFWAFQMVLRGIPVSLEFSKWCNRLIKGTTAWTAVPYFSTWTFTHVYMYKQNAIVLLITPRGHRNPSTLIMFWKLIWTRHCPRSDPWNGHSLSPLAFNAFLWSGHSNETQNTRYVVVITVVDESLEFPYEIFHS